MHCRSDARRRGHQRTLFTDDEARKVPGLYFIGEVMDVTGWWGAITSSGRGRVHGLVRRICCSEVVLSYFLKMKIIRVALK